MSAVAVLHLVTTQARDDIDVWLRLGTAALALGVGAVGEEIGIVPALAVLFVAVGAQIVLELAQHDRHHAESAGIEIG
jgi:hypothetical protein